MDARARLVTAGLGERVGHHRLAHPEDPEQAALEPLAGAQRGGRGMLLDHRPHLRELGGRAGKDDDRRVLPRDDQTGSGADREDDVGASRDERLLLDAVDVLRRRYSAPAGVLVHDLGDPRAQGLVDAQLAPAHACDGRDRAIVVRRPETARGDDDGVLPQRAEAVGDLRPLSPTRSTRWSSSPRRSSVWARKIVLRSATSPRRSSLPVMRIAAVGRGLALNSRWGCQPGRGSRRRPLP